MYIVENIRLKSVEKGHGSTCPVTLKDQQLN